MQHTKKGLFLRGANYTMKQDPAIVQILKTEEQLEHFSASQKGKKTDAQAMQKLLENLYQTVFENSAVAITITDEQERIISWNKYAEHLLDIRHEDVFLQPVHILYPPEEWEKIRSQNIRQKGMQHHLETKLLRRNNTPLDVDLSISVIKNTEGAVVGSIAIIKDISEEKKIKQALQNSEQRFKNLYEHAPIPYHTLSPEGILTNVNEKWCELFGYTKPEVLGKSIFEFIVENERQAAKDSFQKKRQSHQLYTSGHERRYKLKNGEERIFITHDFFTYAPDNTLLSVQTTLQDITDRKKAEEEINTAHRLLSFINQELERKVEERTAEVRNLLKQKDDFINQLGHDLKSPLTPILNLLPTVMKNPEDYQKNKERLEIIYRNALYIKNLVNDTLKLARLNSATVQLNNEPVAISSVITETLKELEPLILEKNIRVQNHITSPYVVTADVIQLKEVFTNLFSNSIKFMDHYGTLTISAEKKPHDAYISISITDTGIGLTSEQKKHLFQEFYKADPSRHDIGSSGLGLTICKNIIERHGGSISVESLGLGKGTTFTFTLPTQDTKRKQ